MSLLDLAIKVGVEDNATGIIGGIAHKAVGAASAGAKAAIGLTGAAAAGLGAIGVQAGQAYADYEQLVGGIDKLYGSGYKTIEDYAGQAADSMLDLSAGSEDVLAIQQELIEAGYDLGEAGADGIFGPATQAAFEQYDKTSSKLIQSKFADANSAADKMKKYAADAYKTAGMSANEYMETATQFSAALINSVNGDTEEAARLTDVAMRLMSDNVNTFGSDAESVQNAVIGLSRGNFTMLDNLKLGFAGTQEGMLELINASGVYGETLTDVSQLADVGFDTMIEAIQAVQEQQGIAGTTANEAATTISGSITMAKASWENFLTAIANPDADMSAMTTQLIDSFQIVLDNVVPLIGNIADGIAQALPQVAEKIIPVLSDLLDTFIPVIIEILPLLIDAVSQVMTSLAAYLPELIPVLVTGAITLFSALADGVTQNAGAIWEAVVSAITETVNTLNGSENLGLFEAGSQLLGKLINGVAEKSTELYNWFSGLVGNAASWIGENWDAITAKGSELLNGFFAGVQSVGETVLAWFQSLPTVLTGALGTVGEALNGPGGDFIQGFLNGISSIAPTILDFFVSLPSVLIGSLGAVAEFLVGPGAEFIQGFLTGIGTIAGTIVEYFTTLPQTLLDLLGQAGDLAGFLIGAGADFLGGLFTGIGQASPQIAEFFTSLPQTLLGLLGDIGSFLQDAGTSFLTGFSNGVARVAPDVVAFFTSLPGTLLGLLGDLKTFLFDKGSEFLNGLAEGAKNAGAQLGTWVANLPQTVLNIITGIPNFAKMLFDSGSEFIGGLLNGFKDMFSGTGTDTVSNFVAGIPNAVLGFLTGAADIGKFLLDVGKDFISGFIEGLGIKFDGDDAENAMNFFTSIPGKIAGWLGELDPVGWLVEVGGNVIQGFVDGIQNFNLRQAIIDTFGPAGEIACNVLGINSPSTVFKEIGDYTMQGMKEGLEGGESDVDSALATIAGGLPEEFVDAYWSMHDQGAALMTSFQTGMTNVFNRDVLSWLSGIGYDMQNWTGANYYTLWDAGQSVMIGFGDALVRTFNSYVAPTLQSITNAIPSYKGPLQKDMHLLEDNGQAIMHGLLSGIRDGSQDVYSELSSITSNIQSTPTSTISSAGSVIMADAFRGANITFRNRDDMEEFSEMLADHIARETMGRYAVA